MTGRKEGFPSSFEYTPRIARAILRKYLPDSNFRGLDLTNIPDGFVLSNHNRGFVYIAGPNSSRKIRELKEVYVSAGRTISTEFIGGNESLLSWYKNRRKK